MRVPCTCHAHHTWTQVTSRLLPLPYRVYRLPPAAFSVSLSKMSHPFNRRYGAPRLFQQVSGTVAHDPNLHNTSCFGQLSEVGL